jgi:hypothetical protein
MDLANKPKYPEQIGALPNEHQTRQEPYPKPPLKKGSEATSDQPFPHAPYTDNTN